MPWTLILEHECPRPPEIDGLAGVGAGSVWLCPTTGCEQAWLLESPGPRPEWRRVTQAYVGDRLLERRAEQTRR